MEDQPLVPVGLELHGDLVGGREYWLAAQLRQVEAEVLAAGEGRLGRRLTCERIGGLCFSSHQPDTMPNPAANPG